MRSRNSHQRVSAFKEGRVQLCGVVLKLEDAELARSLRVIGRSLEQARDGKGRPMKQFLKELADKYGIELSK